MLQEEIAGLCISVTSLSTTRQALNLMSLFPQSVDANASTLCSPLLLLDTNLASLPNRQARGRNSPFKHVAPLFISALASSSAEMVTTVAEQVVDAAAAPMSRRLSTAGGAQRPLQRSEASSSEAAKLGTAAQ